MDPDVRFAGPLISLSVSFTVPVPFDIPRAIRPPLRFLQTWITPSIIPHLAFLCTVFRWFYPVPLHVIGQIIMHHVSCMIGAAPEPEP